MTTGYKNDVWQIDFFIFNQCKYILFISDI